MDIHKELVDNCKQGDHKAQYQLYQLYAKAMYNICFRMMNSREEAEDMLQEAFVDAFTKLYSFNYESTFGAWLKRIVINNCINEIKRKKPDLTLQDDMGRVEVLDDEEYDEEGIQWEVKKVNDAIESLPEGYRVITSLYLLEGYDHREIAEIMNISESTSKSQYMRAKKKILEQLKMRAS